MKRIIGCGLVVAVLAAAAVAAASGTVSYTNRKGEIVSAEVLRPGGSTDTGALRVTASSPINFRKSEWTALGTSGAPCNAGGTTAGSAAVLAGSYLVTVSGEAVAICDGRDTDCAGAPADLPPGAYTLTFSPAMAGTFHCRSTNGLGWITLRKVGP